jgi:hypothetical protein
VGTPFAKCESPLGKGSRLRPCTAPPLAGFRSLQSRLYIRSAVHRTLPTGEFLAHVPILNPRRAVADVAPTSEGGGGWKRPGRIAGMELIDLFARGMPFEDRLAQLTNSTDQFIAFQGRKLAELVRLLSDCASQARVFATLHGQEIWLSGKRRRATVKVDWFDRSPLVDGFPISHYRIEIRGDKAVLKEERVSTKEEAALMLSECLPV